MEVNNTEEIKLKMLDEDPPEREIENIGPIESILEGVKYSLIVWIMVGFVIYTIIPNNHLAFGGSVLCGFFAGIAFFLKGFNQPAPVQTSYLAAIKSADERVMSKQGTEGWIWLFPFIYTYQEVSAVEITIVIGSDENPLEILAVGEKKEGASDNSPRDIIQLEGKILVRLAIWNAPLSLGYEYKEVETNVVNYVNSTLRQIASEKGYLDFVTNKNEIANSVFRSFKRQLHESNNGKIETYSQQVENMGYRVRDIEFVKVDLPKAVKEAAEAKTIEESQRQSEMTEVVTFGLISAKIKEQFPNLTDKEISDRALLLMGKPINIYAGVGGGNVLLNENRKEA
jgi:hypothetical protein